MLDIADARTTSEMGSPQQIRVMIVGAGGADRLESAYAGAFQQLGCAVAIFDMPMTVNRYCRVGTVGRKFNEFVPVVPWIRKANRDLVLEAIRFRPHLLITFGLNPVRVGSLAQIRATLDVRLAHIWPDPLINLGAELIACLPLYDITATFSRATVSTLERLGAHRAIWLPLAADPTLHQPQTLTPAETTQFSSDITFIGGWRPEREEILTQLGDFQLKIWGPEWARRCRKNPVIMHAYQGRPLRGTDFAKAVAAAKINLNVIDATSMAAANMRFFEIPAARGVQVSSSCPEMENEFLHGKHVFYYKVASELHGLVGSLLADTHLRGAVASAGYEKVIEEHTYTHRAETVLRACSIDEARVR